MLSSRLTRYRDNSSDASGPALLDCRRRSSSCRTPADCSQRCLLSSWATRAHSTCGTKDVRGWLPLLQPSRDIPCITLHGICHGGSRQTVASLRHSNRNAVLTAEQSNMYEIGYVEGWKAASTGGQTAVMKHA